MLCATAAACRAGDIVGEVKISQPPPVEQNRDEYAVSDGGEILDTPPPTNAVEEVVLYLDGKTPGKGRHPDPVIYQRDKSFVPRVLPVRAGQKVKFPNQDQFFHNVFSLSNTKRFDLGRYNTGDSREQSFDTPGLVKLFCEIHARMKGFVLVLESDAFTVPDANGHFKLTDIPPGDYTLIAWHPAFGPKQIPVKVGKEPARVDIQF